MSVGWIQIFKFILTDVIIEVRTNKLFWPKFNMLDAIYLLTYNLRIQYKVILIDE